MLKNKLIFASVLGWALLSGDVSRAQVSSTRATAIDIYDGFETAGLSEIWGTDRFEPSAVEMQTNVVRAGRSAAKITVHTRDKFEAGSAGTSGSERDELREAKKLTAKEGVNYEQSFSIFIPTNFPVVPTWLVIAQWKQYCGGDDKPCADDSPVLAIRYIYGTLKITQNINSPHETLLWQEQAEFRGRWLDFKFQVRFSPGEDGRIKAWLGDKQLVDYRGVTADPENAATGYPSPSRFYFKMGLYRNVMPEPMTIYIDEYRKKELPANTF
jgi:hypothetical protein